MEAIEGSHVSLLCGADSNPLPLLTWMRDGTVLREAVAESLFLDLEEVTPAEDGVYACLAENAYGQENRTVGLSVMCESPARASTGPGGREVRGNRPHAGPQGRWSWGAGPGPLQAINKVEVEMERRASGRGVPACFPKYLANTYCDHSHPWDKVGDRWSPAPRGSLLNSASCPQPWLLWE